MANGTATTPAATPQGAIPFPIASQFSSRRSFDLAPVPLTAGAPTPLTPIELPAVGYASHVMLNIDIAGTGGTAPDWTADGPWNVLQQVTLRTPGGSNIISNVSGFDLYLMNLFGGTTFFGPSADPRFGFGFASTAPSANFRMIVPLMFDAEEALGSIPATASNANFQLDIILAAIPTVLSGAPDVTVTVSGTYLYFDIPAGTDFNGIPQQTAPYASVIPIWQKELPPINPGERLVKSVNVGNIIRTHILTFRDASGARDDTIVPANFELMLDNQSRFRFSKLEFESLMSRWYGLGGLTKDGLTAGTLPNGVLVLPYHALLGSYAGDPGNTRAQLMSTLDASKVEFHLMNAGANANTLEILTQSLTTTNAAAVYGK